MEFFDPDEEVLDFQLTSLGKQLLSKGMFKPEYYAFFDDDVVYDSQYIGITQEQNSIQPRIQDNTPRMHTQAVYDGVESNVKKLIADARKKKSLSSLENFVIQPEKEKHYSLSLPLGNVRAGYEYDSSLKVEFHHGALESATSHITGNFSYNINIPQLTTTASIQTQVDYSQDFADWHETLQSGESYAGEIGTSVDYGITGLNSLGLTPSEVVFHDDGTFVRILAGGILISVEEEGTPFNKDNFEIEIYEVEQEVIPMPSILTPGDMDIIREKLLPLYFEKPMPLIINNILLDEQEIKDKYSNDIPSPDKARLLTNYFFDIYCDEEIDDTVMCNHIVRKGGHTAKDIFNDRPIRCPEDTNKLYNEVLYSEIGDYDEEPPGDC